MEMSRIIVSLQKNRRMSDWSSTPSNFFTRTIVPLFLVLLTPPAAMLLWHTLAELDGSASALINELTGKGFIRVISEVWLSRFFGSRIAWEMIGLFAALQAVMLWVLPGRRYYGTVTPKGNQPEYKDNGLLSYVLTFVLFFFCSSYLHLFSPAIIYTHMGDLLGALNFGALVFCLFLYFKGRYFPSSSDHSTTGNFIFDYYWGTELFPVIAGINVKQFTNCRFGMTGWALAVVSFAYAQREIYGVADPGIIVSAALIFIYLFKFFIWESGYMKSMDIQVDRAGFMICWGCLVWVPAVYTSPVMYMVRHPQGISYLVAGLIFVAGFISIWVNYWADHQRQSVRSTGGDTTIWGHAPVLIHAEYKTESGETRSNILLASGFWGVSRHFHYVPEILSAFFWSCAAGFDSFLPYFYVTFLIVLLTHRAYRDDMKCRNKYGAYWARYCELVPYKIIPWVI